MAMPQLKPIAKTHTHLEKLLLPLDHLYLLTIIYMTFCHPIVTHTPPYLITSNLISYIGVKEIVLN